jgi:hypothetical protein
VRFAVFSALFGLIAPVATAEARTKTYLVVVAENDSLDPKQRPLEFADDDAAKNWEMFSLYADEAALFVVLDEDTARLHPEAASAAEVPEREAILERLERFNQQMAIDLAAEDEPELLLIYAGHGDIDENGEGYITLHDGKLTRSDLYREIIKPSKARFVHVIVDACKSYYLVKSRGKQWKDDRVPAEADRSDEAVRAFLFEEELDKNPRAGVIVATSGDQDTHEWSRYRGGILSHELRSALSGAADVNGDGKVEYSEVRAFLAAANARVKNAEVRLETFSQAPALDRHRPLVDLARVIGSRPGRLVHFGQDMSGHFHIEDERGVRYADVNKDVGTSFDLLVPAGRTYYVRRGPLEEAEIPESGPQRVDLATMKWRKISFAARGAVDDTFRSQLYAVPYGRRFYDGFIATSGEIAVDDRGLKIARPAGEDEAVRPRYAIGYMISGAPAGSAGPSHALDLRYGYPVGQLDLSLGVQLGYGRGESATIGEEELKRFALLAVLGLDLPIAGPLGLRFEGALGWQVLSGTVGAEEKRLEGTEPRGLRAEVGGGFTIEISDRARIALRGGAAFDGFFAEPASSMGAKPYGQVGLVFE